MPVRFLTVVLAAPIFAANPPVGGTILVTPDSPEARRFSGVGRMAGCTVFLIKPAGAVASSPAYVMTSGHCIDLGANEVIVQRDDATRTVQFGLLHRATAPPAQVRSRRVSYSTMRRIDLAIIELDSTLGALESAGIAPLTLSRSAPPSSGLVEWAGIPSLGVPTDERVLRTGECAVSGAADVLEWRWFWRDQIRHDCSDISGGASGSPLIARSNGTVIGVIGTTNVGNVEPASDGLCGRNDPCEMGPAAGNTWRRNSSYATPVAQALACFDATSVFRIDAPGCGLDPGTQATVLEQRLSVQPGAQWNASVTSSTLRFFRYKTHAQGGGDCENESGYGQPQQIPGRVTDPLPAREGRYFLCVVAGVSPTPDAAWQPTRFASIAHLRVDATAPAEPPRFNLFQSDRGFTFIPGASLVTGIVLKTDNAEASTCADTSDYRRIYPVPFSIPSGTARRLCLLVQDGAGNAGRPYEVDLVNPAILPVGVFSSAGYEAGRAAPGSWVSVFGVNLGSGGKTRALLRTRAGREIELGVGYATEEQVNARLPEDVPTGAAEIAIDVPDRGRVSAPITLAPAVPGIFTADARANSFGAILGVREDGSTVPAMICSSRGCEAIAFEGIREFSIFVGGLGGVREVRATFSEQPVDVRRVSATELPGVDEVRVRMPDGLRLRGYIPVRVASGGSESMPAWIWLR